MLVLYLGSVPVKPTQQSTIALLAASAKGTSSSETMSEAKKAGLFESMALGGTAAIFAVNFTHPIVRQCMLRSWSFVLVQQDNWTTVLLRLL